MNLPSNIPQNPLLICTDAEAQSHMYHKMWQRTGLQPPPRINPFQKIPSETDFLLIFGEENLRAYKREDDLFRWMGRLTEVNVGSRIIPATFMQHPSHLLPKWINKDEEPKSQLYRSPARFQGIWTHWTQRALNGKWPEDKPTTYVIDPPFSVWDKWTQEALNSGQPISIDIETAYKIKVTSEDDQEETELQTGAILRISFAWKPFCAVSVPYQQPYLAGIQKILRNAKSTIWHNGANFDVPRLRKENHDVNGTVMDCQDAWHLLESQLPKGLEFVSIEYTRQAPWKHINNSNFGLYSCIDADIALRNFNGVKADLEHFGMWNLFLEDSVELMPYLEKAGQRGNAIDVKYSEDLKKELVWEKQRLNEIVQPLVPMEILPRKHYVKRPFEIPDVSSGHGFIDGPKGHITTVDGRNWEPIALPKDGKVCTSCGETVTNKTEHFKGGKKNPCKVSGATLVKQQVTVIEWNEILPFNLASHHQIKDLIKFYGHDLGWDRKTERESANRKHLEKLFAKYNASHPFYKIKIEEAKVSKTLSTYCAVDLVEADGFLHTHFVNNPWSWRLASTAINMQTWGKRESNKWAKKARRQICARPGYIFVQADSTSIEAILTGYLINDNTFIEVAKKSIHAYLCCQELGIPFTDANIDLVKDNHKGLYNQFKTAVYLLLYGGDPYLMFMENPELFPSLMAARDIQNKIFTILPKLKEWQENLREQAKKEGSIRGIYGHRASFYDVYTFKRDKDGKIVHDKVTGLPKIKLGSDSKSVLSFPAQNGAGKFGRDSLRLMGQSKWARYMTAACFVHDGYMLEVPDGSDPLVGPDLRWEAEQFLVDTLTRPVRELNGLRIPCESDMGYNWADKETNPNKDKWTFTDGNPKGMDVYRKMMV